MEVINMNNIQEIKVDFKYSADWLKYILDLYSLYSNHYLINENAKNICLDADIKPLIDTLEIGLNNHHSYNYIHTEKQQILTSNDNNIVVCFSGGKDSVATAIKYKDLGYNVYLYHIRGINGVYTDEYLRATEIAKYLNLPLYIENIKLSGKNTYLEHPLKNQVICSLALSYGITNNLGTCIAFGDFASDTVDDGLFDRNWSDTQEMWNSYITYIKTYIPLFELKIPFNNYLETLNIVAKNINLLNITQGCLSPQRFKNKLHNFNKEKYSVDLLNNRCGSCWKCSVEYIFLVDNGYVEPNDNFYIHCLDILKKKMKEEKPMLPKAKNYKDVYCAYLYDDYDSSYLKKYIDNQR